MALIGVHNAVTCETALTFNMQNTSKGMDLKFMDDALIHFSQIYESDYPFSDRVYNGLRDGVLYGKYKGNVKEFKEFLQNTKTLMGKLRQKNFPLWVKEPGQDNPNQQKIVLHLVPPIQDKDIQNGEFYYQAGCQTPGTLSVKFAKYQEDGRVKMQPSTVEEEDYDCAFSNDFFSFLRDKNRLGDSMFRTLIVVQVRDDKLKKDKLQKVQAKDYLRVCPEERRGRFRTAPHLSIEETGDEKSKSKPKLVSVPSENDDEEKYPSDVDK